MLIGKHLESRSVPAIRQALDSMLAAYSARRFTVPAMRFDGEGALSTYINFVHPVKGDSSKHHSEERARCVLQALVHACSTPRNPDIQNTHSRYLGI